jgi:hypothetical protein
MWQMQTACSMPHWLLRKVRGQAARLLVLHALPWQSAVMGLSHMSQSSTNAWHQPAQLLADSTQLLLMV